ncbi:MAG: efflux RND transporter periplasmic adaptor subunit [Nitrospirales bacterium]|nr:efflux RND transporter periplasmic adaptor subunit [Nitrospirales bacterium]
MITMYRKLCLSLLVAVVPFACGKHEEPGASNAATPTVQADSRQPLDAPSRIETAVVSTGQDKPKLSLAGKVAYGEDRYSRISSPVQGRVLEVRARLGDRVKAGDILLIVDSPDIAQAYSEFIKEESDLTYAIRAYELAKDLYETKALALKDLKQAENDLVKAKAEFRRAKERLLSLRVPAGELEKPIDKQQITSRFQMRSPLTGTVVERTVTPGQSVGGDASQVLFTVADLDTLQVVADIYERDLDLIHPGLTAVVRVEAYPDVVFSAAVAAIGDVVDPNTRTIKVRAWVDNASHKLKPEMFARLHIDISEGKAFISVPKEAVLEIDGKEFVYIAQLDGTYVKQEVKVGSASDDRLRILHGLKPGDRVVTKGAVLLKGNEAKG